MSLLRFKWVSEPLQTSVSVGGAEPAAQVLLQRQPVWARGLRIQNLPPTHVHACAHTHTHTQTDHANACMKPNGSSCMKTWKAEKHRADAEVCHWDIAAKGNGWKHIWLSHLVFCVSTSFCALCFPDFYWPTTVTRSFFSILFSLFLTFTPYCPALRSSLLSFPISSPPSRRSQYISLLVLRTPPVFHPFLRLPTSPSTSLSLSLHLPLFFSLVAACWKLWALMLL